MEQNLVESTEFRTALVDWFKRQGRKLPWRETADPYEILVSELMLQQTQVTTVLSYYQRWIRSIASNLLAKGVITEGELLAALERR